MVSKNKHNILDVSLKIKKFTMPRECPVHGKFMVIWYKVNFLGNSFKFFYTMEVCQI